MLWHYSTRGIARHEILLQQMTKQPRGFSLESTLLDVAAVPWQVADQPAHPIFYR